MKPFDFAHDKISPFFGEMLRARRNDLGLSQRRVAERIGCSQACVSHHEAGAAYLPRPELFFRFGEVLRLTDEEMWKGAYHARMELARVRHWRKVA